MNMTKLLNLHNNEDYILLDTVHHKSKRDEEGKYTSEAISLIIKNINTGEKIVKLIEKPMLEAYVAKPEVEIENPLVIIPTDDVEKVELSHQNLLKDTAKLIGDEAVKFYWNCLKSKNKQGLDEIKKWKRIFSSDWNIEDFYRYKCLEYFGKKEHINLTKGFLDIEADIYHDSIDLKNVEGDAPINAVTFIDNDSKKSFTFLLRNEDNPLISELENDMESFYKELHEDFDEEFGRFDYNVVYYDKEIDLIKDLFIVINTVKLDFVMIWNMSFDINYIIHRVIKLGYDPHDILCDPTFKYKECYYVKDTRNQKIKLKTDYFVLSSASRFICQMINYGAVRSAQSELDSYKLDDIGESEVGSRKLDYSSYATIKNFAWVHYRNFVKYNIRDVLVQVKIENKVKDVELLFQLSYDSATRINKAFKKSIFLRNIAFMEFKEQGYILGNNFNIFNKDVSEEKFEGALVGNPALNDFCGIILNHKETIKKYLDEGMDGFIARSKSVFENVQDYDYSSLYPSIIILFHIFVNTQYGRVFLNKDNMTKREECLDYTKYDRGGQFIDDLELNEAILFCYRWLNLPSAETVLDNFRTEEEKIRKITFKERINDIRKIVVKKIGG